MITNPNQNPFPGIRSFESTEDFLFFGREKQIAEITNTLINTHFLVIIGSSGCGKSSIVKAGLIPSLFRQKHGNSEYQWDLTLFRPGDDPIGNLAVSMFKFYEENNFENSLCKSLSDVENLLWESDQGLINIVNDQSKVEKKNRLILIDQFEEIFRFKKSETSDYSHTDVKQFVNLLLNSVQNPDSNIFIILTMRSDFLSDCTEYEGLPEAINDGSYLLPRMTEQEKVDAIRKPIEAFGAEISDRLVSTILKDVGDDPDQLPVMQHALMRTWDYWKLNKTKLQPVDLDHYEAIGTMTSALSMHAEEIFSQIQGEKKQKTTEKIFKALTFLGADNRGTRRPTTLAEICLLTNSPEDEIIDIINNFRTSDRAFLMPPAGEPLTTDSMIDISHESIMRVWDRLKEWVDDETKSALLYIRLSKSAELYHEGKTGLWIDPDLQLALQWRKKNNPNITWAKRYDPSFDRAINFLEYSNKQFKLEISKKELKQKQDLKRARRFAIILGTASLISLLFLIGSLKLMSEAEASEKEAVKKEKIANIQKNEAVIQRKEAVIQKKISEQQQLIAEQQKIITEEQKQIAIEQQEIAEYQKKEAINQKIKAEEARQTAVIAKNEAEKQKMVAVEQRKIADDNRIKAENAQQKAEKLRMLALSKSIAIKASELSRTKELEIATLLALHAYRFNNDNHGPLNDPDIYNALIDVSNEPERIRHHADAVRDIAYSSLFNGLISCSDDGTIKSVSLAEDEKPVVFNTGKQAYDGFRCLAVNQSGKTVVGGTTSGEIIVADIKRPNAMPLLHRQHTGIINDIVFQPGSDNFISTGTDGRLIYWKFDSEKSNHEPAILFKNENSITSVCCSKTGDQIFCGTTRGVLIFDVNDAELVPQKIEIQDRTVRSIAISSDDKTLAVGLNTGTILLFNTNQKFNSPEELTGHHSAITSLCFSPNGKHLASGSYDRSIRIWEYDQADIQPVVVEIHDSWVYGISYLPDGNTLLSCSADKSVCYLTINPDMLAAKICGQTSRKLSEAEWNKYIGKDISYYPACK